MTPASAIAAAAASLRAALSWRDLQGPDRARRLGGAICGDDSGVLSQHATASGSEVHYVVSGREDGPVAILIHGGGASAAWWRWLTPHLGRHWRLAALDLSGHGGESGWRDRYSAAAWAAEVAAVAAEVSPTAPPLLVGHSMGGGVALATAALEPVPVAAVALLDSAVWRPGLDSFDAGQRQSVYPSREAAIAAFKLMPPQPPNPEAEAVLAPLSVSEREAGGWSWKWDPKALPAFSGRTVRELLPRIGCPLIEIAGSLSDHVDERAMRILREETGSEVPLVTIDGAYHHVMIDRPRQVAIALLDWARDLPDPPQPM